MSEIKVNKITPKQNCTQVTLGDSGDTFVIPSGVTITNNGTQTGFGRTGTVNWDTTAKTASFTAVSGNGYFVNTTSGAITVTLPATPSAGDIVAVSDYAGTAGTNNITIARNGSNIEGLAENAVINSTREARTYIYVDGTQGWVPVNTNDSATIPPAFVVATGGTITTCGDYKIHTFTGPGTFCVSCAGNPLGNNRLDYLVVAGGGGASGGFANYAAGGGAGGFRESVPSPAAWTASPLASTTGITATAQPYPITVGGGGAGIASEPNPGNNGSNSVFSTIISSGGGFGAPGNPAPTGNPGGSGGGGGSSTGGTGNTPPVSPPQGNPGGVQSGAAPNFGRGGGGGAGAAGQDSPAVNGGNGGAGVTTLISGTPTAYAGGGGGGLANFGGGVGGSGGVGGGGDGAPCGSGSPPQCATANTGGGGGGGSLGPPVNPGTNPSGPGGSGGSGIVIIRYKYQ